MQALIDAFLGALCDPEGGARLYELHSPDAPLRHREGIDAAARIAPSAFAQAHRDISRQGQGGLPRFKEAVVIEVQPLEPVEGASAEGSVTWFRLTELAASRALLAAMGARRMAGELRIGWCTLAERVERWTYRHGLLQSLADYPWMRQAEPAAARALLDASYFRRYWRAPVQFTSLPGARFSCQMSADCCRHDYEITLPPEAQLLVDAIPWSTINPRLVGTRLPVREDGKLQLKAAEEPCRFLADGDRCSIHRVLGRQPFAACCVFPFSFARTPEGIAVGLSPICGSVRAACGLPIQARLEDLHERLVHAEPRSTEQYRLAPGIAVAWEQFRDIETALCECLGAADLPMRRRLYVGARLLGAVRNREPIEPAAWINEAYPTIVPDLGTAIRGMLVRVLAWDRAALRALPRQPPTDLALREVDDAPAVTSILQNTLICKVYSYPFDLITAYNLVIVLYLLTLTMQASTTAPLPGILWRELGSLGVHGLLRSLIGEETPEGFRTLFGTPEFGPWMLAA